MSRLRDRMLKIVDVYNISMTIDRLQIGDIILQSRTMSIKLKTTLSEDSSEASLSNDSSFVDDWPSKSEIMHLYLYFNKGQQYYELNTFIENTWLMK